MGADEAYENGLVRQVQVKHVWLTTHSPRPKPYPPGKDRVDTRTIEEIQADLWREWLEAAGFA